MRQPNLPRGIFSGTRVCVILETLRIYENSSKSSTDQIWPVTLMWQGIDAIHHKRTIISLTIRRHRPFIRFNKFVTLTNLTQILSLIIQTQEQTHARLRRHTPAYGGDKSQERERRHHHLQHLIIATKTTHDRWGTNTTITTAVVDACSAICRPCSTIVDVANAHNRARIRK